MRPRPFRTASPLGLIRAAAWTIGCVITSSILLSASIQASPRLSSERFVLRTTAGDLVFRLYPDQAPQHADQIKRLVRAGVYDGTHFFRLHPGFVLQLGDALDRSTPLSPEARALIRPLPAEFNPSPHRRGTLSMARDPDQQDSAKTSFSILLAPAPHLDGQYTVFGEMESGEDVLQELENAPFDPATFRPRIRLELLKAEIFKDEKSLANTLIRGKIPLTPLTISVGHLEAPRASLPWVGVSTAFIAIGLFLFFSARRLSPRVLSSIGLLCVLGGILSLLITSIPILKESKTAAGALLLGLILTFRLMGQFESPDRSG